MLYLSVMQTAVSFVTPTADTQIGNTPQITLPSQVEIAFAVVVTVFMVGITIYALVKLPMNVAKTGGKIVQTATSTVAPIIIKAQHKKDTKKNRMKVVPKVLLAIKALLVLIPTIATMLSFLLAELPISHSVALIIGIGLACIGVSFFAFQYLFAAVFRIKATELW